MITFATGCYMFNISGNPMQYSFSNYLLVVGHNETLEGKSPLTFYFEKTNISADKCHFVYASTEDPNITNDKVYFLKLNTTIIA